jgi:hypothetical protein
VVRALTYSVDEIRQAYFPCHREPNLPSQTLASLDHTAGAVGGKARVKNHEEGPRSAAEGSAKSEVTKHGGL